jgi:hypothetical protein
MMMGMSEIMAWFFIGVCLWGIVFITVCFVLLYIEYRKWPRE